ncbi:MAG: hypothetical protein LBH10_06690 [Burkholderiaceae bacterium]|nr:hypothetical protein [Burkholderiaceae bacterium]
MADVFEVSAIGLRVRLPSLLSLPTAVFEEVAVFTATVFGAGVFLAAVFAAVFWAGDFAAVFFTTGAGAAGLGAPIFSRTGLSPQISSSR